MSRTLKDRPYKLKYARWDQDRIWVPSVARYKDWETGKTMYRESSELLQLPTTKPKKRKEVDTEDHWMTTPGWWVKMTMNRPERRSAHLLEKKALIVPDIEDFEFPDLGRKPHNYFW